MNLIGKSSMNGPSIYPTLEGTPAMQLSQVLSCALHWDYQSMKCAWTRQNTSSKSSHWIPEKICGAWQPPKKCQVGNLDNPNHWNSCHIPTCSWAISQYWDNLGISKSINQWIHRKEGELMIYDEIILPKSWWILAWGTAMPKTPGMEKQRQTTSQHSSPAHTLIHVNVHMLESRAACLAVGNGFAKAQIWALQVWDGLELTWTISLWYHSCIITWHTCRLANLFSWNDDLKHAGVTISIPPPSQKQLVAVRTWSKAYVRILHTNLGPSWDLCCKML